ncbi:MAG: LuxR C-terminal-related transcriptional regulator [Firmicutes bacterium]|nr:LuxR C-terminal-related transcriptional regulator [Bacillota bacterium]
MNFNNSLSEKDWVILEELNLLIYETPTSQVLQTLLTKINEVIDYSHSLSYLIRYEDSQQTSFQYESPDIPQPYLRLYVEKFIMTDYINWYVRSPEKPVFRESDIVPDSIRLNSYFFAEWMMPIGLYHGAGMIISRNGIKYAGLFLYRSENEPNFSERDIEILRIINERLSRKFYNSFPNGILTEEIGNNANNVLTIDKRLTDKEREILSYIASGMLRTNLSYQLHITENTLNKHLANIYKKLNINTFEQLIQMLKAKK